MTRSAAPRPPPGRRRGGRGLFSFLLMAPNAPLVVAGASTPAKIRAERGARSPPPRGPAFVSPAAAGGRAARSPPRREPFGPRTLLSKEGDLGDAYDGGVEEFGDAMRQYRSGRWVVIVDDEAPIREAVGRYLFERGYQVTACADADTALGVCLSRADGGSGPYVPDAIVSDVRMPGRDGLEFLSSVRSDDRLVQVPFVLLTAKGMTEDRIAGFKAGADAYLPKPFDPEELLTILDNAIGRHETLDGGGVGVDDLRRDLDEIKYLLLEKGGGGVGGGWVEATNVFLTPDERDVLELLCKGLMNREIADELYISTRRVEQHLTSMFRKTQCSNRTELVRWAVSTGNVEI